MRALQQELQGLMHRRQKRVRGLYALRHLRQLHGGLPQGCHRIQTRASCQDTATNLRPGGSERQRHRGHWQAGVSDWHGRSHRNSGFCPGEEKGGWRLGHHRRQSVATPPNSDSARRRQVTEESPNTLYGLPALRVAMSQRRAASQHQSHAPHAAGDVV